MTQPIYSSQLGSTKIGFFLISSHIFLIIDLHDKNLVKIAALNLFPSCTEFLKPYLQDYCTTTLNYKGPNVSISEYLL